MTVLLELLHLQCIHQNFVFEAKHGHNQDKLPQQHSIINHLLLHKKCEKLIL